LHRRQFGCRRRRRIGRRGLDEQFRRILNRRGAGHHSGFRLGSRRHIGVDDSRAADRGWLRCVSAFDVDSEQRRALLLDRYGGGGLDDRRTEAGKPG
jgi:hypothetical protein